MPVTSRGVGTRRYRVFGGTFVSPLAFPELRVAPEGDDVDWTLHLRDDAPPPLSELRAIGTDELASGIEARLWRAPDRLRLEFDDTGTFDLADSGRAITWYPSPGCDLELARVDFLGRVLAVATHESGLLCLHGSAVTIGQHALAFLAPKGSGKSTIAMTLAARGGRLLTDDTLPVEPVTALARPGVHSVRLWDDSAGRFGALGDGRLGLSDKRTFDTLPDDLLQRDPAPLAAIYELVPRSASDLPELVRRTAYPPARGTVALMQHSKLGALLLGAEAMRVFDRCSTVASKVPVYQLEVGRDLAAVDRVAAKIARWHG